MMSLLLVDIGNSRLKWATYDKQFEKSGVMDSVLAELSATLEKQWQNLKPSSAVLCSVSSKEITNLVSNWISDKWQCPVSYFVASDKYQSITNSYSKPEQLGADRWAALIAARNVTTNATCIIDCGTAITLDGLDSDGQHIGGAILPGHSLQTSVLQTGTALDDWLSNNHELALSLPIKSTTSAIEYGTSYGIAGAIDRLILEFRKQLGDNMVVLLTGGGAAAVSELLLSEFRLIEDLVLMGLAVFGENQAGASRE